MAFILTPRFAPAYQAPQCDSFSFCAPVSRPTYGYRIARSRPQRPQYSSFNHFFGQVDELLNDIDRKAQRQAHLEAQQDAHRQRMQRKRALSARFAVNQIEQGWQVNGDVQGFEQENISIEITDGHTLKIAGNTQWQPEMENQSVQQQPKAEAAPVTKQLLPEQALDDKMDGATFNEPEYDTITEAETATMGATSPDSDTESHKSYQATVEEDFEDLGVETSSLISTTSRSSTPAEVKEPKGKEKVVEKTAAPETFVAQQAQPEASVYQQQPGLQEDERVHGSFERTFRFPERIDATNVSANFKDGTLKITVPRAPVQQVRKIAIL